MQRSHWPADMGQGQSILTNKSKNLTTRVNQWMASYSYTYNRNSKRHLNCCQKQMLKNSHPIHSLPSSTLHLSTLIYATELRQKNPLWWRRRIREGGVGCTASRSGGVTSTPLPQKGATWKTILHSLMHSICNSIGVSHQQWSNNSTQITLYPSPSPIQPVSLALSGTVFFLPHSPFPVPGGRAACWARGAACWARGAAVSDRIR